MTTKRRIPSDSTLVRIMYTHYVEKAAAKISPAAASLA